MKTRIQLFLSLGIILSLFMMPLSVNANPGSPFLGQWKAIDADGSDMRLTIAGPLNGPFKITWTESYFGFCEGGPGIARGIGRTNPEDPNKLEAEMELKCLNSGARLEFFPVWTYRPESDWLISQDEGYGGFITVWHRPGVKLPLFWQNMIAHPDEEWVEGWGFAEGTVVSLVIFDTEGRIIYAQTREAGYPEWYPESGYVQFDLDINLQAGDHLWMSDGMAAKDLVVSNLQITAINLEEQTVSGMAAPRSSVEIEYPPDLYFTVKADKGGNWTAYIEGLTAGEGGLASQADADGDLTRVSINPQVHFAQIIASEAGDWFWTANFIPGELELSIYESEGTTLLWHDTRQSNEWGFVFTGYEDHGLDLVPGNYLVVSDGVYEKGLVLESITMDVFDTEEEIMAGTAPPGREVWAKAGPQDWQQPLLVLADSETGAWLADFKTIGFDITEDMRGWSFAHIYDEDGDANEAGAPPAPYIPNPRMVVFPEWEFFDGLDWLDGATVAISVEGKLECYVESESWGGFFNGNFGEGCDLEIGDIVTFYDGETTRTHEVRNLGVTEVDKVADTVAGFADPGMVVYVWPHDGWFEPLQVEADASGEWQVDLGAMGYDIREGSSGRSQVPDEQGNATAVDWYVPNPRLVASISENWFYLMDFSPDTEITYWIYESQEGELLFEGTTMTDGGGYMWVNDWEHDQELEPGIYLVVSDGVSSKDLILEHFTFDLFDLTTGVLQGAVPGSHEGRRVWVGIGFAEDGWSMEVFTDSEGNWMADFGTPVPVDHHWVAAQIFDEDGDASELRPAEIWGQWVGIYMHELPGGSWEEGEHSYYFGDNQGREGDPLSFSVSIEAPLYDGYVLIRPGAVWAFCGEGCEVIEEFHPSQATRFHAGWPTPEAMTYDEAVAHFSGLVTWVVWDEEEPFDFDLFEIRLFSPETWQQTFCTFTEAGPDGEQTLGGVYVNEFSVRLLSSKFIAFL
jgi:hypothetical protein